MDPELASYYASLAWFGEQSAEHDAHLPLDQARLVQLTSALHGSPTDDSDPPQFMADASVYADKFKLSDEPARRPLEA